MAGEGEDKGGEVDHDDHGCEEVVQHRRQIPPEDVGPGVEGCPGQNAGGRLENSVRCGWCQNQTTGYLHENEVSCI